MADFTTSTTTKSAIRNLAEPLADVTAFDNLVQGVIASNPFQCVTYNAKGVNHAPVERSGEAYTARIVYQDSDAITVGLITIRAGTIAAFTAVANHILADATIATALGGIASTGLGQREVLRDPQVPRPERGDLLRGFLPRPGTALIVFQTMRSRAKSRRGLTLCRHSTDDEEIMDNLAHHHRGIPRHRTPRLRGHPRPARHVGPGPRPHGIIRRQQAPVMRKAAKGGGGTPPPAGCRTVFTERTDSSPAADPPRSEQDRLPPTQPVFH